MNNQFCHQIMRTLIFNTVILMTVLGCTPTVHDTPTGTAPDLTTSTKLNFASADEVTAALEERWPLEAINTYCIPERRHNPLYQNLVPDMGVTWEGMLHKNVPTGFDSISWYGTAIDGKLHEYSLNANRGDHFWLLEIGNVESFATQPDVSSDPSEPHFIGDHEK